MKTTMNELWRVSRDVSLVVWDLRWKRMLMCLMGVCDVEPVSTSIYPFS